VTNVAALLLPIGAIDAIRRPASWWSSTRERAIWIVVPLAVIPVVFLSIIGPPLALLVTAAYFMMIRARRNIGEPAS
jgi:hypothetical protein